MSIERRRAPRFTVGQTCRVRAMGTFASGTLVDLSMVGAKVQVLIPHLMPKEKVVLEIALSKSESLRLEARVMYNRAAPAASNLGLQFMALDGELHDALARFVGTLEEAEKPAEARELVWKLTVAARSKAAALVRDAQRGALWVPEQAAVEQGTKLVLSVNIGNLKQPLKLSGKVIRKREKDGERQVGLRLDPPDKKTKALLKALTDKL